MRPLPDYGSFGYTDACVYPYATGNIFRYKRLRMIATGNRSANENPRNVR
jgi:hypothetical protein